MRLADLGARAGMAMLAIPFVAMLVMIGLNHGNVHGREAFRFDITGYDPRDLLRGHYLIFNYVWPENAEDKTTRRDEMACACINGEEDAPVVTFVDCAARAGLGASCSRAIAVRRWGGTYQPDEPLRRYYIPEQHAVQLEAMMLLATKTFSVDLVPGNRGGGQLKMLYVDGEPLPDFLARQEPQESGE